MLQKLYLTKSSYKLLTQFFILGFSIILISYCFLTTPILLGDGYEYILVLQSFFNHLTPDIQISDLDSLIELSKNQPIINHTHTVYVKISEAIQNGESRAPWGIFRAYNGDYFGYHFWFYPLINLPAKTLLALLNQNEFKAFQLTNVLLIIGAMSYTLLLSRRDYVTRILIVLLYLVGCNFLYIKWPHPEVYSASLLLVASCAFLDNRYRLAVLMAALAALQNPSALMFIPLIILTFIVKSNLDAPRKFLHKSFLGQLVQLCLLGCIALIPYGFYYYHFGVFSLIVESGFIDRSLIGLKRLTSILFDLNQGMIIGFPGIMLSVGILFVLRLWRALTSKKRIIFAWSDVLLLTTLLMLIPTLGQINWNAGQEVFSRYAFWTAMPLLVWFAVNFRILSRLTQSLILILILLLQLIPHAFFIKRSWGNYTSLKPHVNWILDNLPGWYKPDPEIFAERVQGGEGFNSTKAPYIYISDKGDIRQILVAENLTSQTSKRICGANGQLVNSKTGFPIDFSKVHFDQQGWGYLNGHFNCSLPITINFSQAGNFQHFIGRGWSSSDQEGKWTKRSKAEIIIPIVDGNLSELKLVAMVNAFVNNSHPQQDVDIIVNGKVIGHWTFINGEKIKQRQLIIPKELANQQNPLQVNFKMLNPVSRFQLGLSQFLSFGLYFLAIS